MISKPMTNAQLNGYLELIAKLVEAKALTPQEAAEIVRSAKVPEKEQKGKPVTNPTKTK